MTVTAFCTNNHIDYMLDDIESDDFTIIKHKVDSNLTFDVIRAFTRPVIYYKGSEMLKETGRKYCDKEKAIEVFSANLKSINKALLIEADKISKTPQAMLAMLTDVDKLDIQRVLEGRLKTGEKFETVAFTAFLVAANLVLENIKHYADRLEC